MPSSIRSACVAPGAGDGRAPTTRSPPSWSGPRAAPRRRGGFAAAAAFLERAAALSVDPKSRARPRVGGRAVETPCRRARRGRRHVGRRRGGAAGRSGARPGDLLRAEIAYTERRGNDAPGLLLRAAQRLEPLDARAARDTYLDAILAAHFAGRLANGAGLREAAAARRGGRRPESPPTASDLLLDGLATAIIDGYSPPACPSSSRPCGAFRGPGVSPSEELRWLWPAAHMAMALWDDESYELLSTRHIEIGRESGLLAVLPTALTTRIVAYAFIGQLAAAEQLIAEMRVLTEGMEIPTPPYGPLFVGGLARPGSGRRRSVRAAVATSPSAGRVPDWPSPTTPAPCSTTASVGIKEAFDAATVDGRSNRRASSSITAVLVELIEAAVRSGEPERAIERSSAWPPRPAATGTDWGTGVEARSQAVAQRR